MWAVFAGLLKPDVRENPDKYYNRPFDVFESYYDINIYRLTAEWAKKYGPDKQMDWGSWLYICDRQGLEELVGSKDRTAQILPEDEMHEYAKNIPEGAVYGVLEVECY